MTVSQFEFDKWRDSGIAWCMQMFGPPNKKGRWWAGNYYFFFRDREDAAMFKLAVTL